jgi:hypothetical protein
MEATRVGMRYGVDYQDPEKGFVEYRVVWCGNGFAVTENGRVMAVYPFFDIARSHVEQSLNPCLIYRVYEY